MRCPAPRPLRLSTRTWLPATVLALVPSTYVSTFLHAIPISFTNRFLQILKVVEVTDADSIRRPYIKQLLTKNLKFPLPHRSVNPGKKLYAYSRPSTFA